MSSILQSPTTAPGRFGPYGGRYVPETLMVPLFELERAYEAAKSDPKFQSRFQDLLKNFAGRPTPLQLPRVSPKNSVARVSISSVKICSTLARTKSTTPSARAAREKNGQAANRRGNRRWPARRGFATVAAHLGLECVVYMGTEDMARQALNVSRMRVLGAQVVGVDSGSRTLKDAIKRSHCATGSPTFAAPLSPRLRPRRAPLPDDGP